MFRRHPLVFTIGLILLAAAVLIGVFLTTFDLNSYRTYLEQQIGQALHTPVRIADARVSVHQGLALDFRDIHIGEPDGEFHLHAAHLYLNLDLPHLLRRRIVISAAELTQPRISLRAAEPPISPTERFLKLPEALRVDLLKIRGGQLIRHGTTAEDPPFVLEQVDLDLADLSLSHTIKLEIQGNWPQKGQAASLHLSGTLTPAAELLDWQHWQVDLKGQIKGLALPQERFAQIGLYPLAGQLALQIDVVGNAAEAIRIDGQWQGTDLSVGSPAQPLPFQNGSFRAGYGTQQAQWWMTIFHATFGDWQIDGPLHISGGNQPLYLKGHLSAAPLPVKTIMPLISLVMAHHGNQQVETTVHGGSLVLKNLKLDGPPADQAATWLGENGTLRGLHVEVRGLDATTPLGEMQNVEGVLRYGNQKLELQSARLNWQGMALEGDGSLSEILASDPRIALHLKTNSEAQSLRRFIDPWPAKLSAAGPMTAALSIAGRLKEPTLTFTADLGRVHLQWDDDLRKDVGTPAELKINAHWYAPRLTIDKALVHLGPLNASLDGELTFDEQRSFRLNLQFPETQLAQISQFTPVLEPIKLGGRLQGKLVVQGAAGQVNRQEGVFDLAQGAASFAGIVGDLNQARGRILLSGNSLSTTQLNARLGESTLQLDARITDITNPQLEIRLQGRDLRPQDLIFPGEEGRFESLEGRLLIDGEGIAFSPVDARTAGGTIARVTGAVRNYSHPRVDLHIAAQYGNVDEILEFFDRPEDDERSPRREGKLLVEITVDTERGHFHNIHFSQGQALIRYQNRTLDIAPLRAQLIPGYYNGRVVWTGSDGAPAQLIVSGSVLDADAAKLYRSQTELRGLVSGKLRGSFYIQGEGGNFWPSSRGGLNFEVQEGVLYRFPVLSKVFSVLNVSQIFAFRLPDMSLEGMPFNRLTADVLLHDGLLSTESLLMDSNAMNLSLIGEVDLVNDRIDALLGVKPLRTVDKIVSRIPIAGWILAGEEKALITAHFRVEGPRSDPSVYPVPVTSLSEKVSGIFRRVLGLPGKVVSDFEKVLGTGSGSEEP